MSKKEFKGTLGSWYISERSNSERVLLNLGINDECVDVWFFDHTDIDQKEAYENAKLICDAGNVRQQIEFDLPELLERYKESLRFLEKAKRTINSMGLSISAHPDNTEGSEFNDYANLGHETIIEIDQFLNNQ